MKETMDLPRSEDKWPPVSFPRLCAHDVDIGACGAFDTDLLAGLLAFANHSQPLVCKINVFSDNDMLVDEGGQAMFFHFSFRFAKQERGTR